MSRELYFEAVLDRVGGYVTQIVACLGERFRCPLVEAAVHEALSNAVIYGVLGIDPAVHGPDRNLETLLAEVERAQSARPSRGRIRVAVETDRPPDAVVRVIDPGPGFDWRQWRSTMRSVASPTTSWSNIPLAGRGLIIMHAGSRELWWNEAGNEVAMRFSPSTNSVAGGRLLCGLRAPGRRERVLVVDDDAGTRVAVRRMVLELGYQVRECDDAGAAVEEVTAWQPMLVLVNARMSGASGLRLVANIASACTGTVVAFASGLDSRLAAAALHAGAFDCLGLPMWSSDLVNTLQRALGCAIGRR